MPRFLILKLQGVMQAWGGHTYEDYRPSHVYPTRSGLLGLLAACLGLDRSASERLQALAESVRFAVRADAANDAGSVKITDFHTVLAARKVDGSANKNPVVSRREYLCDASFTVVVEVLDGAAYGLEKLKEALAKPHYTPFLGRRSCPLGRPLFEGVVEAASLQAAVETLPGGGTVYSEQPVNDAARLRVRDVPRFGRTRQFLTRDVHVYQQEAAHVSE